MGGFRVAVGRAATPPFVVHERELQALIDHVPAMLGYWDRDLRNVVANRGYLAWFGVPPEQIRGRHIRELLGEELFALNEPYIRRVLAGEEQHFEREIPTPDGTTRVSQAVYIPDRQEDGSVSGFFVLVTDVTARVQAERALVEAKAELERRANTDPLTGVANRVVLEQRVLLALQGLDRAPAGTRHVALLMIDLDGFKPVNDQWGHAAGDDVLVAVAARLTGVVREPDLVARIGGDEFVVLLTGLTAPDQAEHVAERVAVTIRQPVAVEGGSVRVTASVGVALTSSRQDLGSPVEMLAAADRLMYVAKGRGGNGWAVRGQEDTTKALPQPRNRKGLASSSS